MRLPDELIARYARLAAFWPASEVAKLEREMGTGRRSPMDAKKDIAEAIAAKYHGTAAGREARERFERTVQRRELPDEMPTLDASGARKVADVLLRAGFAESKRAAERLIAQGGVRIDGEAVTDPGAPWNASDPAVLSVGSRRFVRVFRKPD